MLGVGWFRIGTVTASPRPDGSGASFHRGPDVTDPDLPPFSSQSGTGQLPVYMDGDHEFEPIDETGDPEAVEDGLRDSRPPGGAIAARLARRPRDMVMALGVLLVVIFALLAVYRFTGGDAAPEVDAGSAYQQARTSGAFPVLEPKGLRDKWRPVSALYQPDAAGSVLRIGFQTPGDGSVQLVEGDVAPDTMLSRELGAGGKPTGQADLGGRSWQSYSARKGERALVLQEPERTVIIVGAASDAELRELAGALR